MTRTPQWRRLATAVKYSVEPRLNLNLFYKLVSTHCMSEGTRNNPTFLCLAQGPKLRCCLSSLAQCVWSWFQNHRDLAREAWLEVRRVTHPVTTHPKKCFCEHSSTSAVRWKENHGERPREQKSKKCHLKTPHKTAMHLQLACDRENWPSQVLD